jgi:ATP-dependent Clp protease ATP-binding subunit ClpX
LDKIIQRRTDATVIGFSRSRQTGTSIEQARDIMAQVEPEDLIHFGLIPELVGRLPVIGTLDPLDVEMLVEILLKPRNALLKQYQRLFEMEEVELSFQPEAIQAIAERSVERKTGARGLRAVVEETMLEIMFEIPSRSDIEEVVVTRETIVDKKPPIYVLKRHSAEPSAADSASQAREA